MDDLSPAAAAILFSAPPLPVDAEHWEAIVRSLGFSKQQARIAELIARDLCDKEIAVVMQISESTIDNYMERMGRRTGTRGRTQLITHLWGVSLRMRP